ncbi:putative nucleotidyltransferase substrate binding domain-containing protein [Paenarthrobacter nicotinovorans]|uniref:putative nucleotidyltransferase substrate binding domain-containing protein n=1 Tax=Paenarthrobacter nicotinovorans TaxID=29320 RepID=UPI003748116A
MKEFLDFLGSQSPYDRLDPEDLSLLARKVDVEFFAARQWVINEGAPSLDHLFVVRTGSVEIMDRGRVVDVLGPGDTFGHISVLSGLPPPLAVRAVEDTLCYRLPDPRQVVAHPERLQFSHFNSLVARERLIATGGSSSRLERAVTESMRPIIWCDSHDSIRDVAVKLSESHQSAAILRSGTVLGVVTDDDFRREVATGRVPLDAPIASIASIPALTVNSDATAWSTYLHMIGHGVHHMVVTTPAGKPIGMAGVIDMVASEVRHPLVVRGVISTSSTLTELAEACRLIQPTMVELWDSDVSSTHLGAVLAAVVDSVFRRSLELADTPAALQGVDHSWLLLGSMGRREPLPASDVDTAFVWRGGGATSLSQEARIVRDAAAESLAGLKRCGLTLCPDGANAFSPDFGRPLDLWRTAIARCIRHPDEPGSVSLASAMLDARPVTRHSLGQAVQNQLLAGTYTKSFTGTMTRSALTNRPPAGFVRGFVVERFGEHRGRLNLKRSGLLPVVSLARAMSLNAGDATGTTPDRLDRAAHANLLTDDEAETLKGAFTLYHDILVEQEISDIRNGRPVDDFISTLQLDPLRRRHLRDSFRAIDRIQARIAGDPRTGRP